MSAIRVPGPDGRTILVRVDDGASPRIDRARSGISFTPLTEAIRPFAGMRNLEVRAEPGSKPRAMTIKRRPRSSGGKTLAPEDRQLRGSPPDGRLGPGSDSTGL